jgi:hypothetical protein
MDKKIVVILLFLLIVLPMVSSVPPVTTIQQFTEGYNIQIPQDNIIKIGKDYNFEFHVFNISNGYPKTSGISCDLHLYDTQGNNRYTGTDSSVDVYGDYTFNLTKGNFSKLENIYYFIRCNSSNLGGFSESILRVTYNGEEISTAHSVLYGSLFFIFIFFMISLVFLITKLPESNTKDEEGRILSISYLKYLRPALWFVEWMLFIAILYLSSNIAFAYLGEQLFANILFTLFKITFGFTPVIVVIWFVWMFVKMFHDKQLQNMINRGIFPQGKL